METYTGHKIRSNKKHGTNQRLLNVEVGMTIVLPLKYWAIVLFIMVAMISFILVGGARVVIETEAKVEILE